MWILHTEIQDDIKNGCQNVNFLKIHLKTPNEDKNADFIMLLYSEKKLEKHNKASDPACNRFLLSEPKIVLKMHLLYRFANWPIA